MLAKLKYLIAAVTLAVGLAGAAALPAYAAGPAGGAKDDVCQGIGVGGGTCTDDGSSLTAIIKVIVNILSVVAGIAAVIMIMISGLRYITSGGDSSKIASAKGALMYAIVGLVVVALSQAIVRFVLKNATQ